MLAMAAIVLPLSFSPGAAHPFVIGADISWLPEDEASGATYWDKGVQKDLIQILTEEHNLVKAPGFMGWPWFAGPNICSGVCSKDPAGPAVTFSGNTGLARLPPAVPAIDPYPRSAAMTGPIYRYDGDSP